MGLTCRVLARDSLQRGVTVTIRHRIERVSDRTYKKKSYLLDRHIVRTRQPWDASHRRVSSIYYNQTRFVTTKSFDNLYFPNKELLLRKLSRLKMMKRICQAWEAVQILHDVFTDMDAPKRGVIGIAKKTVNTLS
jgi:hypothetical protein